MSLTGLFTRTPLQETIPHGIFLSLALSQLIGIALIGTLYLKLIYPDNPFKKIKFKNNPKNPQYTLALAITILIISTAITYIATNLGIPIAENTIQQYLNNTTGIIIFVILSMTIVGPTEEYFYRGIIQQRLKDQYTPTQAILLTSIIFSLIHAGSMTGEPKGQLIYFITIFIGALLFGYGYEKTQNLAVPIIAHGIYNAILALSLLPTI